jgi:hypothetical protein
VLGDQFVALEPGAEEDLLQSGEELSFTRSAIDPWSLVGKFIHGTDDDS